MRDYGVVRVRIKPAPFSAWAARFHGKHARRRYNRRVAIWNLTGGYCRYCGRALDFVKDFEVDHVAPRANGGADRLHNMQPACVRCNRTKSDTPLEKFLAAMEVR